MVFVTMSLRTWLFALAIGLTALPVWPQSTTEYEPQQEEGATDSIDEGEDQNGQPVNLTPALEGIETAIRDLIAEEDKIAAQAQQDQEYRDLNAQEGMAFWAQWMFYATAVTVALTALALFAIIRTLHHTKRAADYTEGMLDQARATTLAAEKSVLVTREIGMAQARPYLGFEIATGDVVIGKPIVFVVNIKNHGTSPAFNIFAASAVVIRDLDWKWDEGDIPEVEGDAPSHYLHPNGSYTVNLDINPSTPLDGKIEAEIRAGQRCIFARVTVYFRDAFTAPEEPMRRASLHFEFSGEQCFVSKAPRMSHDGNYGT